MPVLYSFGTISMFRSVFPVIPGTCPDSYILPEPEMIRSPGSRLGSRRTREDIPRAPPGPTRRPPTACWHRSWIISGVGHSRAENFVFLVKLLSGNIVCPGFCIQDAFRIIHDRKLQRISFQILRTKCAPSSASSSFTAWAKSKRPSNRAACAFWIFR